MRELGGKVYGFGEYPGKYAYVLSGSVSGDRINGTWWDVPKGPRGEMGSLRLQWSQHGARVFRKARVYGGSAGGYVWKNGGCPDNFGLDSRGRKCSTAAMIFPSGIQAYVAANSYLKNIQNVLGRAFDAALED